MARKADRLALITDSRLSDTARVLGLYVAERGDDWQELRADDFARVAHGFPSPDTIARCLRQLQLAGWVERRPGGRGHGDYYRFRPGTDADLNADRSAPVPYLNADRSAPEQDLSADRCLSNADVTVTSAPDPDLNAPHTRDQGELLTDVVVGEEGVEPPVVPLSDRVEWALRQHGELLAGCRGALRDYLAARVAGSTRQYSYVQKIAGWLNDLDPTVWRLPDGSALEPGQRRALLADALNDLAASQEHTMTRPVGDPANLRTKINALLRQRGGVYERGARRDEPGGDRGKERGAPRRSAEDEYAHLG